jgi:predicted Zn-dependent peptidase
MRRTIAALLSYVAVAALVPRTGAAGRAAVRHPDPTIAFERYTLENGLEVILHRDNSVPLVAVDLWYHVGAGNEQPGKSGFAHLFEHMLFQGAEHIGEDVHFDTLRKIGASSVNGSTTFDRTNYFEVVPSHQLEVALWLESDRMGYLLPMLNEKSLANQIDVVRNERRQNYDNVAYRKTLFAAFENLYPEGHPHRYFVIGRHKDLESATLADVRNFYKRWYVPANATLVLAGDFDTEQAKALVSKWFGSFPALPKPEHARAATPELTETVRLTIEDDFAKLRQIQYVWHSPPLYGEGDAELDILAKALTATGTGRLYKILVHEKQLAQNVSASQWSMQATGLFFVTVTLKSDADLAEVEKIVADEIARVMTQPIEARELQRAVVQHEAGFVWGLESLLSRAETLQGYNHFVGAPDYISADLARYRTTDVAKVRDTAARTLGRPRVELLTVPSPSKESM